MIPTHEYGDVIVAAVNSQRKGMVDVNKDLYTNIGYFIVLCMKYIFIPIVVGVAVRVISGKLLQPQPEKQRKKRS